MSTILKALKRVEAEREVQAPRPLREEVVAALEAAETLRLHRSRRWKRLAVLGGGALVAAIAVWLVLTGLSSTLGRVLRGSSALPLSARTSVVPGAAPPAAAARPEASAAAPKVAPRVAADPSPSSVDPGAEAPLGSGGGGEASLPTVTEAAPGGVPQVAVVPRPPAEPAFQDDEPAPAAPSGPPPGSIPPSPKQAPGFEAAPAERTSSAAPLAAEPEPSVPDEPAPEPAKPARRAASAARRAASTRVQVANPRDVDVLQTVWHPHPERRLALLLLPGESAARELREGDTAEGWTVLSIEPSSVLLLHDGIELRAAVGSRQQ